MKMTINLPAGEAVIGKTLSYNTGYAESRTVIKKVYKGPMITTIR